MRKFLLLLLLLATYASAQSTSQVTTFTATGSGSGVNLLRTGVAYYQLVWHGAGTRSTCTIAVDYSVDNVTYTAGGVITGQSCTSDGAFTTTTPAYYNYMRVTVTALSGSGNTVTAVIMGWINSPVGTSVSLFAGAPSGACTARQFAVNTVTGALYDCVATIWTLVSGSSVVTSVCQGQLGDGNNAISAGTYVVKSCTNGFGVTYTITGVQAQSDNAGTSTVNAANDAATALLTGAITANTTWVSGTQSATTTIASTDSITFTIVADGTSKRINFKVVTTR